MHTYKQTKCATEFVLSERFTLEIEMHKSRVCANGSQAQIEIEWRVKCRSDKQCSNRTVRYVSDRSIRTYGCVGSNANVCEGNVRPTEE